MPSVLRPPVPWDLDPSTSDSFSLFQLFPGQFVGFCFDRSLLSLDQLGVGGLLRKAPTPRPVKLLEAPSPMNKEKKGFLLSLLVQRLSILIGLLP